MQKKVLTEQALYFGDVSMPKGFEINYYQLSHDTLQSNFTNEKFLFSRTWDMLNTYIREHINLKYTIKLIPCSTFICSRI